MGELFSPTYMIVGSSGVGFEESDQANQTPTQEQTATAAASGAGPANAGTPGTAASSTSSTGSNTNMLLIIGLLISAVGIALYFIHRK